MIPFRVAGFSKLFREQRYPDISYTLKRVAAEYAISCRHKKAAAEYEILETNKKLDSKKFTEARSIGIPL